MPGTDAQADVSKLAGVRKELVGLRDQAKRRQVTELGAADRSPAALEQFHREMAAYYEGQATAYELAILAIDHA